MDVYTYLSVPISQSTFTIHFSTASIFFTRFFFTPFYQLSLSLAPSLFRLRTFNFTRFLVARFNAFMQNSFSRKYENWNYHLRAGERASSYAWCIRMLNKHFRLSKVHVERAWKGRKWGGKNCKIISHETSFLSNPLLCSRESMKITWNYDLQISCIEQTVRTKRM